MALVAAIATLAAWLRPSVAADPAPSMHMRPLTTLTGSESGPTFSPDGTQVAFAWDGEQRDNSDIYVKLVGSTEVRRLTTDPATDFAPQWSPDGKWIAYARSQSLTAHRIRLMSSLGGSDRGLGDFPLLAAGHLVPGWTVPGCGTGVRGRGRRPEHRSLPGAGRRRRAPPAHASRGPGTAGIAGLVAQRSSSRVCVVFTCQLLRATAGSRRDLRSGGSTAPALAAARLYDQRSRLESRRTVRDLQRYAGRVLPPLASGSRRSAPARPDRSCGDRGQGSRGCSGCRPPGLFKVHRRHGPLSPRCGRRGATDRAIVGVGVEPSLLTGWAASRLLFGSLGRCHRGLGGRQRWFEPGAVDARAWAMAVLAGLVARRPTHRLRLPGRGRIVACLDDRRGRRDATADHERRWQPVQAELVAQRGLDLFHLATRRGSGHLADTRARPAASTRDLQRHGLVRSGVA